MEIECWKTSRGEEDVYNQILALKDEKLKKKIYKNLEILSKQKNLINSLYAGFIKKLRGPDPPIYEVITKDVRITFCVKKETCWLLTLFIKNSKKTPLREINKAESRVKSIIY